MPLLQMAGDAELTVTEGDIILIPPSMFHRRAFNPVLFDKTGVYPLFL